MSGRSAVSDSVIPGSKDWDSIPSGEDLASRVWSEALHHRRESLCEAQGEFLTVVIVFLTKCACQQAD